MISRTETTHQSAPVEADVNVGPSSIAYLLAELERIDLYLRLQLDRARRVAQSDDRFQGLYISEQEVAAIASQPAGLPGWATAPWAPVEVERAFAAIAEGLAARRAKHAAHGQALRLDRLMDLCGLDRFDLDVLLIGLAPETDVRYERLFAYLQDDVARRQPSVDLLLNLLCPSLLYKMQMRERFAATAPLIRHQLIELHDDPARAKSGLLGKLVRVDARIVQFLMGADPIDAELLSCASVSRAGEAPPDPIGSPAQRDRLELLTALAQKGPLVAYFHGPRGVGKHPWAARLAAGLGRPLLTIDGARLVAASKEIDFERAARRAAREAALRDAVLFWSGFDTLLADDRAFLRDTLLGVLMAHNGVNILGGRTAWEPGAVARTVPLLSVEIARPAPSERIQIWRREIGAGANGQAAELGGRFRLTEGEIRAAAAAARDRSLWGGLAGPTIADLYAACRAQSRHRLGELARQIRPRHAWDDLVLPPDATRELREICDQVRYRARVLEDWGFDAKLSMGKGLAVVFAGASGTGKTMAADIIAGELGLDLYKIDLSGVVSKYIGETEKNLSRVFAEAENTNAILFFDEADALFGKRSEVKDAHDRYANIETGYLLQKMEEYEGITILATNLRRNMDDAFVRRMAFVVAFPLPEETERLRLWQGMLPAATPRSDDLDLPYLARQFRLTGGNIKNVALGAAFLAASDGGVLSMRHLVRGVRRELQKMGTSLASGQFGDYASLVADQ